MLSFLHQVCTLTSVSSHDVSIAAADYRVHAGAVDLLHPADQESVRDPQRGHLK